MKHLPIDGYEGLYEISEDGMVLSVKRNKYLVNVLADRYFVVLLYKNNKRKMYYVHRLVAAAFCKKAKGKDQVNHKDLNRLNNNSNNLEWVNAIENISHYRESDKFVKPIITEEARLRMSKKLMKKVFCKITGKVFDSIQSYSLYKGISIAQASTKLNGKFKNNLNAKLI